MLEIAICEDELYAAGALEELLARLARKHHINYSSANILDLHFALTHGKPHDYYK